MRIGYVQGLAIALKVRYGLLRQIDDLEQSILHYTEAIFLPPHSHGSCLNVARILFSTAQLLLHRASHTEQPEDVKRAVIYLRYLHGQSPEAFNIAPATVKEKLVCALAHQV